MTMGQQNVPTTPEKNTTGTNPTDRRTNETPTSTDTYEEPAKEQDRRGTEGSLKDDNKSSHVPNSGRDITTGGTGADGTNRKMPTADSTTGSTDMNSDHPTDAAELSDEAEEEEETKA